MPQGHFSCQCQASDQDKEASEAIGGVPLGQEYASESELGGFKALCGMR
jgi:hypothetical protein